MKVMVVYRPKSEHSRQVEDFLSDLRRRRVDPDRIEKIDVDTREGVAVASLYDVMQYPKVMVVADDGRLIQEWDAGTMPLQNEVTYYVNQSPKTLQTA